MAHPLKLFATFVLLWALTPGPKARAQYEGPWCAVVNIGRGAVQERCSMATFEQCRREAQLGGASAFCRQNSRYLPYWGMGEQRPARKKKRRASVR